MNWLDILLIIVITVVLLLSIFGIYKAFINLETFEAVGVTVIIILVFVAINGFIFRNLLVLDFGSGSTTGQLTAVDSTFFGKELVYIKTSESEQLVYCIDPENKNDFGDFNKYIGKNVKITYGTRVGFYSTSKCKQAPIDTIEIVKE